MKRVDKTNSVAPRGLVIGLTMLAAAVAVAIVGGHGAEPRLVRELAWKRPNIVRALAASTSHLGAGGGKVPAEVRQVGGRDCVVGAMVALDVDDTFAFDIDEPVEVTVVYGAGSTGPFTVSWDRNSGDGYATATEVLPEANGGSVTFRLDRARLSGQGILGTDLAVAAPRGGSITLCDLKVSRPAPVERPAANASFSLKVIDAATGREVPARVGLYASNGRMPLPSDEAVPVHRFADEVRMQWLTPKAAWPVTHRSVFFIDGSYASKVPAGSYDLVVARGPEYRLHRSKIELTDGQNEVSVRLDRYADLPASGWYSGDSHVHLMRDKPADMAVWNFLAAEDLHIGHLLEMGNITTTYYRQPAYGEAGIFAHEGRFLIPGQEDPRTVRRGHTVHWNVGQHAHLEDSFFQYHTVFERTRASGAVTGYAHLGQLFNGERGLATDVPFGIIEFIEVLQGGRINTDIWYSFLNLGYRVSPVGGADYPYFGPTIPGVERTYVKVDGPLTPASWLTGFRRGDVYVSNGPFLELTINGQPAMGRELRVAKGATLDVKALARLNPDVDALDRIELVALGDVVKMQPAGGSDSVSLETTVTAEHSMWLAIRAYGRHQESQHNTLAHTAPVYVVVDDEPTWKRSAVPELIALQRQRLLDLRTLDVDPMGDLEAWETKEKLVSEWTRQLPLLVPRIEAADQRYAELLAKWKTRQR